MVQSAKMCAYCLIVPGCCCCFGLQKSWYKILIVAPLSSSGFRKIICVVSWEEHRNLCCVCVYGFGHLLLLELSYIYFSPNNRICSWPYAQANKQQCTLLKYSLRLWRLKEILVIYWNIIAAILRAKTIAVTGVILHVTCWNTRRNVCVRVNWIYLLIFLSVFSQNYVKFTREKMIPRERSILPASEIFYNVHNFLKSSWHEIMNCM